MKIVLATLTVLPILAACSTGPDVFVRQPWATISQGQADAECERDLQSFRVINMYYCMKGKGYEQQFGG